MTKALIVSGALATLLLTGCATSQLQTNAKMTQSVFLNPVAKEKRSVFISMRNTSGQNINLEPSVTREIEKRGYKVVDDPETATYVLMANVLYCDKKRENNTGTGAGVGGGLGAVVGSVSGSRDIVTSLAGAAVGGLVGGIIGKATEDTIYQMQVDIVVREKSGGKVLATSGTNSGQASVTDGRKAGFMNSFGGAIRNTDRTGNLNSNQTNQNSQTYERDYVEHKTMMFAEATKRGLELEEALPILQEKISVQIAGLF